MCNGTVRCRRRPKGETEQETVHFATTATNDAPGLLSSAPCPLPNPFTTTHTRTHTPVRARMQRKTAAAARAACRHAINFSKRH